jgi:hypothetical protein
MAFSKSQERRIVTGHARNGLLSMFGARRSSRAISSTSDVEKAEGGEVFDARGNAERNQASDAKCQPRTRHFGERKPMSSRTSSLP